MTGRSWRGRDSGGLPQDIARQHALDRVDTQLLVELKLHWSRVASEPDLQLRLEIERPCRLDAEPRDASVRNGLIFHFAAGQTLPIHEDQSLVREHEHVADQLECLLNPLPF